MDYKLSNHRLSKIELKNDGLHVEFIPNVKPLKIIVLPSEFSIFWKEIEKAGDDDGVFNLQIDIKSFVDIGEKQFRFDDSPQWILCTMEGE